MVVHISLFNVFFPSSSSASRLLSDPHRTKLLSYFNCLESCLFLCGNQATRLLSWESTTAPKKNPSKVAYSSYFLVNKVPALILTFHHGGIITVQLLKKSISVIFKNSRSGREREEGGTEKRLIGQSLSVEVFDFDWGARPQASHLSSAQIVFFIIFAAYNSASVCWSMSLGYETFGIFPMALLMIFFSIFFCCVALPLVLCILLFFEHGSTLSPPPSVV